MNAEGRIATAARWISGANGTLGGAAGTTVLGYGKSKWQRATEANRAVEYAIKGVIMALDGRVNQRHISRSPAAGGTSPSRPASGSGPSRCRNGSTVALDPGSGRPCGCSPRPGTDRC